MADESKARLCRSFVRVRPFTDAEALVCPEESPVPREVIIWDDKDTLSVLDPQNGFSLRKNGVFPTGNVLWSFKDLYESTRVIQTQKDVYQQVVAPVIPSIVAGYNAAFCFAGAANSGRCYTLYGEDINGPDRGILPRFAEDIFDAFDREKKDNSTLHVELEAVDISGESYVDLFAARRSKLSTEELKVVPGPDGPRLQGVVAVELQGSADFMNIIRQLIRSVGKRNTTHTVNMRFTETFEFDDPENFGQPVSKSRQVQVVFALLRNMPAAFQRCIDVAVEHDSGENPLAKVPVRETAFTKRFPGLLQQEFNLNIVTCVSPYYEHVRENVNSLTFAMKVHKLTCKPKLHQDESLLQLRLLADEVQDLKMAARNQSETMQVVQKELNRREVELMKQEADHNTAMKNLLKAQEQVSLATVGRNFEADKNKLHKKIGKSSLAEKRGEVQAVLNSGTVSEEARKQSQKCAEESEARIAATEAQISEEMKAIAEYQKLCDERAAKEQELQRLLTFSKDPPDVQKKKIVESCEGHKSAEAEIQRLAEEEAAVRQSAVAIGKQKREIEPAYEKVFAAEAVCRERDTYEKEVENMEKEMVEYKGDISRMQREIDMAKSRCQCRMM